ncbi:MAG TPA: hypothetical protein VGN13_04805 [Solirubrobacteraceae bacterium]|jgi:hypothetical protein
MYHVEMRQFPHNFCRFNLTDAELRPVVEPWVREKIVEFGERKWSPHEARLTILEGPELALRDLTMGRGWRAAQRVGEDVTERVLGGAVAALQTARAAAAAQAGAAQSAAAASSALSDPLALGVQIASLLGSDPTRLLDAWREASASAPGLTPSQALALAEETLATPGGNGG